MAAMMMRSQMGVGMARPTARPSVRANALSLKPLPYAPDALEPHMSKSTFDVSSLEKRGGMFLTLSPRSFVRSFVHWLPWEEGMHAHPTQHVLSCCEGWVVMGGVRGKGSLCV